MIPDAIKLAALIASALGVLVAVTDYLGLLPGLAFAAAFAVVVALRVFLIVKKE